LDGVVTVYGLASETHYFWVDLIDARDNTAGPQSIGYAHIRHRIDTKFVDHGNNIVAEGDLGLFNGSNSYANFADIAEAGVDYGEFVRSGTWSMTFWIKPLVAPSNERRFLVIMKEDLGLLMIASTKLHSTFTELHFNLIKNTWHFFALSVDGHHWTIHTSTNTRLSYQQIWASGTSRPRSPTRCSSV
jgi:hypothetical protein